MGCTLVHDDFGYFNLHVVTHSRSAPDRTSRTLVFYETHVLPVPCGPKRRGNGPRSQVWNTVQTTRSWAPSSSMLFLGMMGPHMLGIPLPVIDILIGI